jgi:hypothetical protein
MNFVDVASIDVLMVGVWMVVAAVVLVSGAIVLAHLVERRQRRQVTRHQRLARADWHGRTERDTRAEGPVLR